jgi:hypothetical protein
MKTTWMVGGWLVIIAAAALAQEENPSRVAVPKPYSPTHAAESARAGTDPPPGERLPVQQLAPTPVAEPPRPTRTYAVPVEAPQQSIYVEPSSQYPQHAPYPSPYTDSNAKLDHLRKAIEHLKSAGLEDEARRITALLGSEMLRRKEAQLKALQKEVDQLRATFGSPRQVMFHVQVIDVPLDKLRKLAAESQRVKALLGRIGRFGEVGITPGTRSAIPKAILDADDESEAALGELLKLDGCKIVADPKLVTVSGRPAHFRQGGKASLESPIENPQSKLAPVSFGTEVDLVPQAIGNDRLQLELRIRVSELVEPNEPGSPPRVRIRNIDTEAEFKIGQVLLLGGMTAKDDLHEPVTTFFILRSSLISADDEHQ